HQLPATCCLSSSASLDSRSMSRRERLDCSRACGDLDPRIPAGGTTPGWKRNARGVEPGAHEQPGDQGVRVPHLSRSELVSAPHGRGDAWHKIEQPPRYPRLGAECPRATDRFG